MDQKALLNQPKFPKSHQKARSKILKICWANWATNRLINMVTGSSIGRSFRVECLFYLLVAVSVSVGSEIFVLMTLPTTRDKSSLVHLCTYIGFCTHIHQPLFSCFFFVFLAQLATHTGSIFPLVISWQKL